MLFLSLLSFIRPSLFCLSLFPMHFLIAHVPRFFLYRFLLFFCNLFLPPQSKTVRSSVSHTRPTPPSPQTSLALHSQAFPPAIQHVLRLLVVADNLCSDVNQPSPASAGVTWHGVAVSFCCQFSFRNTLREVAPSHSHIIPDADSSKFSKFSQESPRCGNPCAGIPLVATSFKL